ncbi:MAG: Asd/ArgC dimerization domain-containing protein [Candidatus Aminicenantes bacterium]|nr:Asd/ArgC dimerization domain-containing protein [Candidatus Aminicenantes bacterium]
MTKTKSKHRLALVGTGSLRGQEIKNILAQKKFPAFEIELFDPEVQEDYSKLTQFKKEPMVVHSLAPAALEGKDLVFLASDAETSEAMGKLALAGRFKAIDLSETFNDRENVPLIVSGVNDDTLKTSIPPLLANPHAVTIILSGLFHRIVPKFGLKRAVSFVLRPVSAFDDAGIQELASQSVALLNSSIPKTKVFKEQIAFNILSHTDPLDGDGFTSLERRLVTEIRRVLGRPEFPLVLSIIQVPVFHTYSVMTYFELKDEADIAEIEALLKSAPFKMTPFRTSCEATPLKVSGKDEIFVGQIKREPDNPKAFWIWLVADNLTRGAALNAFELARKILGVETR